MARAFARIINNLCTRLSTGIVDNLCQASKHAVCGESFMNIPRHLKRYFRLAQPILARGRLPALLLAVASKRSARGVGFTQLGENLRLLQGLCMAWFRGEYRAINPQALLSI